MPNFSSSDHAKLYVPCFINFTNAPAFWHFNVFNNVWQITLSKTFSKPKYIVCLVPLCPHSVILLKNSIRSVRRDFLLSVKLVTLPLFLGTMFICAFSYHILYCRLYHLTRGRSQAYQGLDCKIPSRVLAVVGSYTGSSPILWHSCCLWWQITFLANHSAISHMSAVLVNAV